MPKLIDVVVDPFSFVFTEFKDELWYFPQIDFVYLMQHSGNRTAAPIIDNLLRLQADHDKLDQGSVGTLAVSIRAIYGNGWARQYKALEATYNPIENYDSTEERTPEIKHTTQYGHRMKSYNDDSGVTDDSIFGFNAGVSAPANSTSTNRTSNQIDEHSGQDAVTESGKETIKRHGNIGVTTSQQMIESELELRKKIFIEDVIFRDVDEFLTLAIYE